MKQSLLFEDTRSIELAVNNIRLTEKRFNVILEAFNKLDLKVTMTKALMIQLIKSPYNTVQSIYMAKIPEENKETGLRIDKETVLKTLQIPDLKELNQAVESFNPEFIDLMNFGKSVSCDEGRLNEYFNRFRIYAKTEAESLLFDRLKSIENQLNALDEQLHFLPKDERLGTLNFNLGEIFRYKNGIVLRSEGFKNLARLICKQQTLT